MTTGPGRTGTAEPDGGSGFSGRHFSFLSTFIGVLLTHEHGQICNFMIHCEDTDVTLDYKNMFDKLCYH